MCAVRWSFVNVFHLNKNYYAIAAYIFACVQIGTLAFNGFIKVIKLLQCNRSHTCESLRYRHCK